jgi:quinol monooxygenase YgiN
VVDEWETAEHHQQFFGDPGLQAFSDSVGLSAAEPEITVAEAITSPDQF